MTQPIFTTLLLLIALFAPNLQANSTAWERGIYQGKKVTNHKTLVKKQHDLFKFFLDHALRGKGKALFQKVSARVKNNITWQADGEENVYEQAFLRSYPFVRQVDLQGMPDIILLIPYLESLWGSTKGNPAGDYGYWQLVPEVLEEIQTLDYVPEILKTTDINTIRSDAKLSTLAAQVHLRRYWFYFNRVAKFPESDAWLLTITSYNWGAGNVKRLIAEMRDQGIPASFSNFYAYLYAKQQKNPKDKSMRAAVEYLPNLWNISQLLHANHK